MFIDEITAIDNWQMALKRLADAGELRGVLVVTTGSKATDLRRGTERLPGRKGKLGRSWYHFPPLAYKEFLRAGGDRLGPDAVLAYVLSGGCPVASAEMIAHGLRPEYITEMVRDWIYGEVAASGRNRSSLLGVFDTISRYGGNPCGQAKVAREAGLANNTVAAGYLELLMDLMCVGTATAWDAQKKQLLHRKPAKYHFINLLAAVSWHSDRPESVGDFKHMAPQVQGAWYEWAVAQELWRRAALKGEEFPERMAFWQGGGHELDFVLSGSEFLEVKRGASSPLEFAWVPRTFPGGYLTVINTQRFEAGFCKGITLEDFLLGE
jgi:predicted AAA+ superfamily ATPase